MESNLCIDKIKNLDWIIEYIRLITTVNFDVSLLQNFLLYDYKVIVKDFNYID